MILLMIEVFQIHIWCVRRDQEHRPNPESILWSGNKGIFASLNLIAAVGTHIIKQLKELWSFPKAKSLPHTLFFPCSS